MSEPQTTTTRLLDTIRVVDLTGGNGGFAGRLLADLGAEVVRIEDPSANTGRGRLPQAADGTSLHHLHRNLGKTIVAVPLGSDDGRRALDGLLAGADIALCSGDLPTVDPAVLHDRHPHLVVVSIRPFGATGSYASWRSTELVAQSLAGAVYRAGVADLPPVAAPGAYAEDVGAAVGAMAALIALWQVRDGGHGQLVDLSTVLALAQCMDMSLPLWSLMRMDQTRAGAGLYPLFECTDGLARLVLPMSPADWRSLIVWLGSPPEWSGAAWEQPMLGPDERAAIMERLPARFAGSTRAEIAADGDAAGLRVTPVLTPGEVLTNEHVTARATFVQTPIGNSAAIGSVVAGMFGVDGQRSTAAPHPLEPRPAPSWPARARPTNAPPRVALPLTGIRVLEVGSGVAAPEAGRVLAEWGADVIKIETLRRADFQRRVMGGEMNPAFATPNRNKRALAVDLGTAEGQALVHRLLPQIDVVIENNAAGVIERLGLGWDELVRHNPRIVLVGSQLYGDRGPWAAKKGYGPSARAIGGLTWLWAHGPDAPRGVMTIHPDHLAGRLVALGALAGLLARDRNGTGCRLDVAQFEAVSTLIGDLLLAESLQPGAARPTGNSSPKHAPWGLYRCADDATGAESWLALCVTDDATWSSLLGVGPAALDRVDWATQAARRADAEQLDDVLSDWLRSVDAATIEAALQQAGVPAGQVLHPRLQAEHPFYVERGYPTELDQPDCGRLVVEGPAFTAGRMGVPRCAPAPRIGEHTAEVLVELLGLDHAELGRLADVGAIDRT